MDQNGSTDSFFKLRGKLIGRPAKGTGDRFLDCPQYGRCLTFAAELDWSGFNCQACTYEHRGKRNFIFAEFSLEDDEVTLHFLNEAHLQSLMALRANQEDLVLNFIEKGLLHESK